MAKFLNTLFSSLGVFLLCFLWVVYCTKNGALSFALSAVVAIASAYIVFRGQNALYNRKQAKRAQAKKIYALGETLRFGENNSALLEEMFRYYRFETEKIDFDNFTAQKNGQKSYVAIRFATESASREEIARAVVQAKRNGCDKLYLFAHKADKTLLKEANDRLPTHFADVANLYQLLEQSDRLPELACPKTIGKTRFAAQIAFNRRRFWWYMGAAMFMLAISALSLVKWYTLAWATVSLFLALYCLLNKRYNTLPTAVTLD